MEVKRDLSFGLLIRALTRGDLIRQVKSDSLTKVFVGYRSVIKIIGQSGDIVHVTYPRNEEKFLDEFQGLSFEICFRELSFRALATSVCWHNFLISALDYRVT